MIGCDVRKMEKDTAALLTNREVLAINQDPLGKPAQRAKQFGPCEIWKKPLSDGALAVALINRGSSGSDILLKAGDIGLLDASKLVRNLWAGQELADFKAEISLRVQPHETILLKVQA
jgi:alpha-galactosidase